jgi:hypothetical protein
LRKTLFHAKGSDLPLTTSDICRIFAKEMFLAAVSMFPHSTLAVR